MSIVLTETHSRSILTRSSGYLTTVTSHSLQPYRGCSFGRSLCGVGCYVQHNPFLTRGAAWGSFLESRANAAELYAKHFERERTWARRKHGRFSVFMSSSTDPFVPHERRLRVTRTVLQAMLEQPPDALILQTHTHLVAEYIGIYRVLRDKCDLRVHISVESDRDRLPGLPPPASPVRRRLEAAAILKQAGVYVVVTVSPLLPIESPTDFFTEIDKCAHAVVVDHYIGGDGSRNGARTAKTALPAAIARIEPDALLLDYRDRMVGVAREIMPGRVGVGIDGFSGSYG